LAHIPSSGYSEESAISINESELIANFSIDHERHFWKVKLGDNQNGTLFLKESTPTVLFEARITIYPEELKNNPVLSSRIILGSFNYSWNAFAEDNFIIEVVHNPEDISPIGLYNISFIAEEVLWDYESAGKLPFNQTINVRITQGFGFTKQYYFRFHVNLSRSEVFIRVFDETPLISKVLDYADVFIEELGLQKPIYSYEERYQENDGEFNITNTLDEGEYYLIISLQPGVTGQFSIHFEYQLPTPFLWNFPAIILSLVTLVALPVYLIFLDSKGKWYRLNQWTLPTPLRKTYKLFRNSFTGFFKTKEVPDESILIQVESLPLKTYALINFVESSERETLIFSKRLKRRLEWIIYILIGFLLFDFLNLLFFVFFSIHFLPIYIPNLVNLLLFLVIPTGVLVVCVLFVNLSSFITYSQIINRLSYIVQNYQDLSEDEVLLQRIDPVQALKSINYVRVLWNQAKHAFKDKNYELFVIKADASVKNLLSTRFQQLVSGNKYTKPDFQIQATELRKRGFDLPSDKRITHFRNLRNRIVHSSVTLDEKESVDCFAYYSTFITRLGLRPN